VLVLQSETDVILLGGGLAEQPDSEYIRVWEMAGAAHADTYTISGGRHDDGTLQPERLADLLRPTTDLMIGNTDTPINAGPSSTTSPRPRWPTSRVGGPAASLRHMHPARRRRGSLGFRLDQYGLAVGGIRTPWVEVPTAVMSAWAKAESPSRYFSAVLSLR